MGGPRTLPRVDQTHASGGRPSWHDGRRGSVREVRGRKCGARSGFPFFFFGNQDFQKTRRSMDIHSSKVHSISSTSPRPAERTLARGLHKSRADTTKSGTGRDRRAWSDPPDRAHRRRARLWKRDQTTSPHPALAAAWDRGEALLCGAQSTLERFLHCTFCRRGA